MKKNFYVTILSVINVFRSFLLVGQALISKFLVDDAILAAKSEDNQLLMWAILFAVFIILNISLCLIYFFIKNRFSLRIEVDLKKKIYDALIRKDILESKKYHSGELSNIYLADLNNVKNGVTEIVPSFCLYLSRFVLALLALIYLDPRLLLVLILIGAVLLIAARVYSKFMKKHHKAALESDGNVNAFMQESFENIKVVKAMTAEDGFSSYLEDKLKDNYNIKNKRNKLSLMGSGGLFIIVQFTSAFTLLYGAYAIAFMGLSYGSLTGLMQVVSYFESPISQMSSLISQINAYKVSLERIENIFKLKDDEKQKDVDTFESIEINNVSFSYDRTIFDNLNMVINKGDTVVIKGPSGAGKSTLFNLLLGFINPESGELFVNANNEKLSMVSARKLFSYVPQENILFSGTIEDNVKLFVKEYTQEQLVWALKQACVYDEIMEKPKKLNTPLQERGGGLSLGQIQRVLLAISLLLDHEILLLDEFTSALDKDLEKRIVDNIVSLDKTKIIITHRDIVVENAKILKVGE